MDRKFLFYFFTALKLLRLLPRKIKKILPRRIFTAILIALALCLIFFGINAFNTPSLPKENNTPELYSNQTSQDLKRAYLNAINSAKQSILLIAYSITDQSIINAVNKKAREGLAVTLITDFNTSKNLKERLNPAVKIHYKQGPGLMHLKLMVIDTHQVWVGSANITGDSFKRNGNLVVGINSPLLAKAIDQQAANLLDPRVKPPTHTIVQLPQQRIELWFFPAAESAGFHRLLNLLYQAKKIIRIAMYAWTHPRITEAVIDAYERGVDVEIVLDRSQTEDPSSAFPTLLDAGINVKLSTSEDLLHYKMALIDDNILISGSANWTRSAFNKNDDCFLVIDPLLPEQIQYMHRLWSVIASEAEVLEPSYAP